MYASLFSLPPLSPGGLTAPLMQPAQHCRSFLTTMLWNFMAQSLSAGDNASPCIRCRRAQLERAHHTKIHALGDEKGLGHVVVSAGGFHLVHITSLCCVIAQEAGHDQMLVYPVFFMLRERLNWDDGAELYLVEQSGPDQGGRIALSASRAQRHMALLHDTAAKPTPPNTPGRRACLLSQLGSELEAWGRRLGRIPVQAGIHPPALTFYNRPKEVFCLARLEELLDDFIHWVNTQAAEEACEVAALLFPEPRQDGQPADFHVEMALSDQNPDRQTRLAQIFLDEFLYPAFEGTRPETSHFSRKKIHPGQSFGHQDSWIYNRSVWNSPPPSAHRRLALLSRYGELPAEIFA